MELKKQKMEYLLILKVLVIISIIIMKNNKKNFEKVLTIKTKGAII